MSFHPNDLARRSRAATLLSAGIHGSDAARIASKIIARYLGVVPEGEIQTEG